MEGRCVGLKHSDKMSILFERDDMIKIIERTISHGSQSMDLLAYYTIGGYNVQVEIKLDSYYPQSHAGSKFLTSIGWQYLYHIPYPEIIGVKNKSNHYEEDKCTVYLQMDEQHILDISEKILKNLKTGE